MPLSAQHFSATIELDFSLDYLLYRPERDGGGERLPLIVFLHGAGERGSDLALLDRQGLPRLLSEGLELPAVVIAPQCPAGQLWSPQIPAVSALVGRCVDELGIDRDRISVTGLSLGGGGACELVGSDPGSFAGLAPICGRHTASFVTEEFAAVPTWVFHGDADEVVPIDESYELVEAIRAHGGEPRFTVYPGVGHNSWDRAYEESDLLDWLLAQRLSDRSAADRSRIG